MISVDASVDMSIATCIDRVSVATRPKYRPTVGRVSVEYRLCVDQHVGRYVCRPICMVVISLTLGRYLIDALLIVYRYLTDTQSTHGQSMI